MFLTAHTLMLRLSQRKHLYYSYTGLYFAFLLQLLILKNLQSNILLHFNTAAELFPDGVSISLTN